MNRRNPRSRRMLMHKLRWLAQLDAAGDKAGAQRVFMSLPLEARGVLALLIYAGRFRTVRLARATQEAAWRREFGEAYSFKAPFPDRLKEELH